MKWIYCFLMACLAALSGWWMSLPTDEEIYSEMDKSFLSKIEKQEPSIYIRPYTSIYVKDF